MTDALAQRAEHESAWHGLTAEQVLAELGTTSAGLSSAEAQRRRPAGTGPDAGPDEEGFLEELLESFVEPLQLLLIVVAVLSAVFGELRDALAIGVIVVLVAVVETVTETRSANTIAALSRLAAPTARVVRDGRLVQVPAAELAPGDVVDVEAGDVVPADLRVVSASGLRVDESAFTGETAPAGKGPTPVAEDAGLAERSSMLFAGTAVVAGGGRAVVVAVGADSELGRLGRLVAEAEPGRSPLQRSLAEVARAVLVVALIVSTVVPLVGLVQGRPPREMLLAGLSMAFATVPEELPILITVLLAVAGRQLARRGALLRRLASAETLGAITVVVTDKTGTLTRNELALQDVLPAAGCRADDVLLAGLLSQAPTGPNAREPLETSLAAAAAAAGVGADGREVDSHPFDAASKLVTRVWERAAGRQAVTAGAPESVLDRCDLSGGEQRDWLRAVEELSRQGHRLVAFARRDLPAGAALPVRAEAERDLSLVGIAVFRDPLRDGVPAAVAELRSAGVATLVVTGDHPLTAASVAAEAGLGTCDVLGGGRTLERMSDSNLLDALGDGTVVARAAPADKLRIVELLRSRGEVVAVTGDGVNDAPALAAADVGIAMGRRGSDLARRAAGVVLVDDAYPTVAAAVATGRNVSTQLRRAVGFYLGAKVALVLAMLIPLLIGRPAPFTPATIALLELFMDLGASVAFVAEPPAAGIMRQPPRPPGERFLSRRQLLAITAVGLALTAAVLPAYLLAGSDVNLARGAALAAWLAGHALVAWAMRADTRLALRRNPAFPAWALLALLVAAVLTTTPWAAGLGLTPLGAGTAALVAAAVSTAAVLAVGLRAALRLDRL